MRIFLLAIGLALSACATTGPAQIGQAIKAVVNNQPPPFAFDPARAPPAPDYANLASWAALPELKDATDLTPAGVIAGDPKDAEVDVFFIYPTVFFSRDAWNADARDAEYRQKADVGPLRGQASVFNGCCRVYAPHYRQMTLGGYVKWSPNSVAATELAYSDVNRAFDEFLKRTKGRPFIIAGQSQGARLGRLLVERRIEGSNLRNRLVAAYLIGHWIESAWFDRPGALRACRSAIDTGCVIGWSTFAEGRNATSQRLTLGRTSNYAPEKIRRPYTCINPISWTTAPTRTVKSMHRGSWLHGPDAAPRPPEPGLITARCVDGAVYVSPPGQKIYQDFVIPFGNYHNLDMNMFYMDIRDNLPARIGAFWKR